MILGKYTIRILVDWATTWILGKPGLLWMDNVKYVGIITSFSPEQREDVRWWFLNPAYSVTHCAYLSLEALRCNQSGNPLTDVIFGAYEDTSMHVCIQLPLSHSRRRSDKSCMLGDSASANRNLQMANSAGGRFLAAFFLWNCRPSCKIKLVKISGSEV